MMIVFTFLFEILTGVPELSMHTSIVLCKGKIAVVPLLCCHQAKFVLQRCVLPFAMQTFIHFYWCVSFKIFFFSLDTGADVHTLHTCFRYEWYLLCLNKLFGVFHGSITILTLESTLVICSIKLVWISSSSWEMWYVSLFSEFSCSKWNISKMIKTGPRICLKVPGVQMWSKIPKESPKLPIKICCMLCCKENKSNCLIVGLKF